MSSEDPGGRRFYQQLGGGEELTAGVATRDEVSLKKELERIVIVLYCQLYLYPLVILEEAAAVTVSALQQLRQVSDRIWNLLLLFLDVSLVQN